MDEIRRYLFASSYFDVKIRLNHKCYLIYCMIAMQTKSLLTNTEVNKQAVIINFALITCTNPIKQKKIAFRLYLS